MSNLGTSSLASLVNSVGCRRRFFMEGKIEFSDADRPTKSQPPACNSKLSVPRNIYREGEGVVDRG